MRLTQKQEKFCINYFKCGNASEAGILAGYSPRSIRNITSVLLTKANIVNRISQLRAKVESSAIADVTERKEILTGILRAKLTDFLDVNGEPILNVPNNAAANEYSVTTKYSKLGEPIVTKEIKLHSPIQAIAELNKMEKIYSDNNGTTNINIDNRKVILVSDLTDEQLTNIIALGNGSGSGVIESPVSPQEPT